MYSIYGLYITPSNKNFVYCRMPKLESQECIGSIGAHLYEPIDSYSSTCDLIYDCSYAGLYTYVITGN